MNQVDNVFNALISFDMRIVSWTTTNIGSIWISHLESSFRNMSSISILASSKWWMFQLTLWLQSSTVSLSLNNGFWKELAGRTNHLSKLLVTKIHYWLSDDWNILTDCQERVFESKIEWALHRSTGLTMSHTWAEKGKNQWSRAQCPAHGCLSQEVSL